MKAVTVDQVRPSNRRYVLLKEENLQIHSSKLYLVQIKDRGTSNKGEPDTVGLREA
jgi:hypothetical protein